MSAATPIVLSAIQCFLRCLSLWYSFNKADELEMKRDSKNAEIEDTGAVWGENETLTEINKYGMEQESSTMQTHDH